LTVIRVLSALTVTRPGPAKSAPSPPTRTSVTTVWALTSVISLPSASRTGSEKATLMFRLGVTVWPPGSVNRVGLGSVSLGVAVASSEAAPTPTAFTART
jgi:hypothetical protein